MNHDIDDGLRAGLFAVDDLFAVPLAGPVFRDVSAQHPSLDLGRLIGEAVRRLITILVNDVVAETPANRASANRKAHADVRALDGASCGIF